MAKLIRKCPHCGDEQITQSRTNFKMAPLTLERLRSLHTTQVCLNRACRRWTKTCDYDWRVDPTPRQRPEEVVG